MLNIKQITSWQEWSEGNKGAFWPFHTSCFLWIIGELVEVTDEEPRTISGESDIFKTIPHCSSTQDIRRSINEDFQRRTRPPEAVEIEEKRKCSSKFREDSCSITNSSWFFVLERKMISGELVLLISLSLKTVCGFPRPQQFQLKTTKEEADDGRENPKRSFSR